MSTYRQYVSVEEKISFPELGPLVLGAVVFALGTRGGRFRYACACRAPDGDFWFLDGAREPWRLGQELSNVLRGSIVLLVYTRSKGQADFAGVVTGKGSGRGVQKAKVEAGGGAGTKSVGV